MWQTIGSLLPLATAIAISPTLIIAVILLLLGKGGRAKGGFFVLGCLIGTALITGIAASISAGAVPKTDDGGPHIISAIVKIVLGLVLLWMAVHTWQTRPESEAEISCSQAMCSREFLRS